MNFLVLMYILYISYTLSYLYNILLYMLYIVELKKEIIILMYFDFAFCILFHERLLALCYIRVL